MIILLIELRIDIPVSNVNIIMSLDKWVSVYEGGSLTHSRLKLCINFVLTLYSVFHD